MKNKICIVTSRNIFDSPCLTKYEKVLDSDFDIIYWNRAGIDEKSPAKKSFVFERKVTSNTGIIGKVIGYFKYASYCKKVLKKNKYDRLIVFPTQTAWLIKKFLKKHYKGKYVIDIRDYAGENKRIIYKLTKYVVENCGYASITSKKYESFLPRHDYHISHNLQPISQSLIDSYRAQHNDKKKIIRISFIGSVRFIEQQKKIILLFKNDERFHLSFIGKGSEQLEPFCKANNVNNVSLIGFFKREQLGSFYAETEIALNAYGHGDPFLDYALSNKIYSSATMGMPIIVSPHTYMSDIVSQYGIGFVLDDDDPDSVDSLFDYYTSYSNELLYSNASRFLRDVNNDEEEYIKTLSLFLKN